MSEPTESSKFLRRCATGNYRIVCTCDLTEFQIAEARVNDLMFVDDDGIGYVLLPWGLTTGKDKAREVDSSGFKEWGI